MNYGRTWMERSSGLNLRLDSPTFKPTGAPYPWHGLMAKPAQPSHGRYTTYEVKIHIPDPKRSELQADEPTKCLMWNPGAKTSGNSGGPLLNNVWRPFISIGNLI